MSCCCWCGKSWSEVMHITEDVYVTLCLECLPIAAVELKPAQIDVGRNDPCPCGSGLKYKKCCDGKTAIESKWSEASDPTGDNDGKVQQHLEGDRNELAQRDVGDKQEEVKTPGAPVDEGNK